MNSLNPIIGLPPSSAGFYHETEMESSLAPSRFTGELDALGTFAHTKN